MSYQQNAHNKYDENFKHFERQHYNNNMTVADFRHYNKFNEYSYNGQENVIDDIYVYGFSLIISSLGILANLWIVGALLRRKCNGTSYIIIQFAIADIITQAICFVDVLYVNQRKWIFPADICPIYLGLDAFSITSIFYFVSAMNLHACTAHTLAATNAQREAMTNQQAHQQDDDASDDISTGTNQQSLSAENDNYEVVVNQRSITIDYRKRKNRISVVLPSISIWCLAISISLPYFIFGSIIPEDAKLCGIHLINFDLQKKQIIVMLLLLYRIFIPTLLMLITTINVATKLYFSKIQNSQHNIDDRVVELLELAVSISISFALISLQRIYGSLLYELLLESNFKYPNFQQILGLSLDMLYFVLPLVRPILYYFFDKNVRDAFWPAAFMRRKKNKCDIQV